MSINHKAAYTHARDREYTQWVRIGEAYRHLRSLQPLIHLPSFTLRYILRTFIGGKSVWMNLNPDQRCYQNRYRRLATGEIEIYYPHRQRVRLLKDDWLKSALIFIREYYGFSCLSCRGIIFSDSEPTRISKIDSEIAQREFRRILAVGRGDSTICLDCLHSKEELIKDCKKLIRNLNSLRLGKST